MVEFQPFYDSANPANVPSGVHAAVYINGQYAWSEKDVARMGKIFRVSVEASSYWADEARCIDVENGAGTIPEAVAFVVARRRYGFDDATVYCDRSTWPAAKTAFAQADVTEPLWWIATLDGTTDVPGAWAVQYHGGMSAPFDLSVLVGVDNFHRP